MCILIKNAGLQNDAKNVVEFIGETIVSDRDLLLDEARLISSNLIVLMFSFGH